MKWFKHFTDNHRGQSIQNLLDKEGHVGVSCYWILVELCAEKLERNKNESVAEVDCEFNFHQRVIAASWRVKPLRVAALLNSYRVANLLTFTCVGSIFKINMPILLDLLDYGQKKAVTRRFKHDVKIAPDKELDKDTDTDKETELPATKQKLLDRDDNRKIWDSYFNAYRLRYGIDALRNATVNAQVSNLRKKLGVEDAVKVIEFYLKHNDAFYLKNTHSFGLCLSSAETLRTQMLRGKAITSTDARNGEKDIRIMQNLEDAKKGGF